MGAICNGNIINGAVMAEKIIFENPLFHIFSSLDIGVDSDSKIIKTPCALFTPDGEFLDVQDLGNTLINETTGYDGGLLTGNKFYEILEKEKAVNFYLAWDSSFLVKSDYTSDGRFAKSHSNIYLHHAVLSEEDVSSSVNSIGLFGNDGKKFISSDGRSYTNSGDGIIKYNVFGKKEISVSSGDSLIDSFIQKEV